MRRRTTSNPARIDVPPGTCSKQSDRPLSPPFIDRVKKKEGAPEREMEKHYSADSLATMAVPKGHNERLESIWNRFPCCLSDVCLFSSFGSDARPDGLPPPPSKRKEKTLSSMSSALLTSHLQQRKERSIPTSIQGWRSERCRKISSVRRLLRLIHRGRMDGRGIRAQRVRDKLAAKLFGGGAPRFDSS